jgi:hypothetical protein
MKTESSATHADYPYANTEATQMLSKAVDRLQRTSGKTQRQLSAELGYKTSVVLSHMVSGRVPIPLDKTTLIADVLGLDRLAILLATLKQRFPDVPFNELLGVQVASPSALERDLRSIAGVELDELNDAAKHVLREVVASRNPERRWLSPAELPVVEAIREFYPKIQLGGLTAAQQRSVFLAALALLDDTGASSSREEPQETSGKQTGQRQ